MALISHNQEQSTKKSYDIYCLHVNDYNYMKDSFDKPKPPKKLILHKNNRHQHLMIKNLFCYTRSTQWMMSKLLFILVQVVYIPHKSMFHSKTVYKDLSEYDGKQDTGIP